MNIKEYQDYLNSSVVSTPKDFACECYPAKPTYVDCAKPTAIIVDPSLAISNAAADARVVGLRFNQSDSNLQSLACTVSQIKKLLEGYEKDLASLGEGQTSLQERLGALKCLQEQLTHLCADLKYFKNQTTETFCDHHKKLDKLEGMTHRMDGRLCNVEEAVKNHCNALQLTDSKMENIQSAVTHLNEKVHRLNKDHEAFDCKLKCEDTKLQNMLNTISDLKVHIAGIEGKLESLFMDNGNITLKDLYESLMKLEGKLCTLNNQFNDKLQKAIKDLDKEFEVKLHTVSDKVNVNAKAIENLNSQIKCLKTCNDEDEIKARLDKLDKNVGNLGKNLNNTEKKLNDKIEDTEDALNARITSEFKSLDARQDSFDRALATITSEVKCIKQCKDNTKVIDEIKTKVNNLDTKLNNFSLEITEKVNKTAKDLRNKIADESNKLHSQIDESEHRLDNRMDANEKAMATLTNKVACLEKCSGNASTNSNTAVDKLSKRIEDVNTQLTTKITEAKNEVSKQVKNVNTALTKRIDDLDAYARADHKSFNNEINKLNSAMAHIVEQVSDNKSELEEAKADYTEKFNTLRRRQKNFGAQVDAHFLEIEKRLDDKIEARIDKNFTDIAVIFEKLNSLETNTNSCECGPKIEQLGKDISSVADENAQLKKQLTTQNNTIKDLQKQIESLKEMLQNIPTGVQTVTLNGDAPVIPDEKGNVELDIDTRVENYYNSMMGDVDGGDLDGE